MVLKSKRRLTHQIEDNRSGNMHSKGIHIFLKRLACDFPQLIGLDVCLLQVQNVWLVVKATLTCWNVDIQDNYYREIEFAGCLYSTL